MSTTTTTSESIMSAQPQTQHQWLQKLVGEWTYETEVSEGAEGPTEKMSGTEKVGMLGDLWILCEGEGNMCDGIPATTLMTLGYDPQKQRYVGTWIGSMMKYLWVYDGEMDATGQVLTLNSEGPTMTNDGTMATYKDVIKFIDDDHRVMTSHVLGDDGQWHQFVTTHYRRI